MHQFTAAVFAATYLGMAFGRVPGLTLDRTGIALLGAVALLAAGVLTPTALAHAIDFPTLAILFGLMILSAQFAAAGFYDWCAGRIAASAGSPARLLALTVLVAGALSALLANDIVVFAMTPLLCTGVKARGLDARPFLAALAGASNAGSAATVIGNPQNILIGQVGGLDFWAFAAVCIPPALAALLITYVAVRIVWRAELAPTAGAARAAPPPFDRTQAAKAGIGTLVLILLFLTPLPREVAALVVAACLLVSRKQVTRTITAAVDWHLILLFIGLFAVNAAFDATGLPGRALAYLTAHGFLPDRLAVMAPLAMVLSNSIGNVPAVVMLLSLWQQAPTGALYGLALLSTLAGNLLLVGSIANLIVAERAGAVGVRFGFADHVRAGLPMALASLALATLWLGIGGWMPWH